MIDALRNSTRRFLNKLIFALRLSLHNLFHVWSRALCLWFYIDLLESKQVSPSMHIGRDTLTQAQNLH